MFRLCKEIGCKHPKYLEPYLTSHDVAEWIAFGNIEPFGSPHEELLNAIVAAEVSRQYGDNAKGVLEFMPSHNDPNAMVNQIRATIQIAKESARGTDRQT